MKKLLVAVVVLALVLCAASVWSQGGGQGRQGAARPGARGGFGGMMTTCPAMAITVPQPPMLDRMTERLGLTDDQVAKLKEVCAKTEDTVRPLMQKAATSTQALRESVLATEYDTAKTKELAASAEKAEAAIMNARLDAWTQIRSILTADQAAKLKEMMTMPRPGPGGPGAPGPAGPPPGGEVPPPPGGQVPPPPAGQVPPPPAAPGE